MINWKKRLKNKTWWVGIISLLILLGEQLGVDVLTVVPANYEDIAKTIFLLIGMLGVTVDTSTKGMSDY